MTKHIWIHPFALLCTVAIGLLPLSIASGATVEGMKSWIYGHARIENFKYQGGRNAYIFADHYVWFYHYRDHRVGFQWSYVLEVDKFPLYRYDQNEADSIDAYDSENDPMPIPKSNNGFSYVNVTGLDPLPGNESYKVTGYTFLKGGPPFGIWKALDNYSFRR